MNGARQSAKRPSRSRWKSKSYGSRSRISSRILSLANACESLHRLGPLGVGENHAVAQSAQDVSGPEILGVPYHAPATRRREGWCRLFLYGPDEVLGDGRPW